MPLFRIMGGNSSNNNSGNNNNRSRNAPPNAQQQSQSRSNAMIYPGNRLNSSVPPSTSLPSSTSSGGSLPTHPQGASQQQTTSAQSNNPVFRGSLPGQTSSSSTSSSMSPPSTNTVSVHRPGAYAVSRTATGPAQVYKVVVPQGVRPGAEFTVHAGNRRVRVRCPPTSRPGHSLQITLPPEPQTHHLLLKMAPLTSSSSTGVSSGGAHPMTPEVQQVNRQAQASGGTAQTFLVTIPPNIYPGMQFTVNVHGQRFLVTCPSNAGPNMKVRIVPPTVAEDSTEIQPKLQVFEVTVPAGVRPNQPFTLMANGQRVLVTCPPNVVPGQTIRFQLPVQQVIGSIQLSYENSGSKNSGGWCRTIRVTDLKFQWVRTTTQKDSSSQVDDVPEFDFSKSAYCRKITYLEGNDARMRTGTLELVPAKESVVDSKLVVHNKTLLSYADIATYQSKSLDEKSHWLQTTLFSGQLTAPWDDGHVKIVVRRNALLTDSVAAVMSLGRDDMRKRWRMEFLGEPGIDAGGVTREWFALVSEQLFDPDFGLWLSSINNQMMMTINPASNISCPDDHLVLFRFLGRVLGRALFDRQLVKGHMVRHIYKHLLGWPITFDDLQAQDEEYYQSLQKFTTLDDPSVMCLDFTVTEETMGVRRDVELIPGGNLKEVTKQNLPQYLEANLRYRMLERTKPQLTELVLGFFDVIPEPPLTILDPQELELLLCGLPKIDMSDWETHTIYSGLYEYHKVKPQKVVTWFWNVVKHEFDDEMKARLLQFVTGTSGVPTRGFSVLQGNDGNIKQFAIHGVDRKAYVYPRAHTCFNRIDLPNYTSQKELYEKLKTAITMSGVGFDME